MVESMIKLCLTVLVFQHLHLWVEGLQESHDIHSEQIRLRTKPFSLTEREDLELGERVPKGAKHRVVFARKQRNVKQLKEKLDAISNPFSSIYGQHMSRDEVAELSSDSTASEAINSFLDNHGIERIKTSRYGDYVTAEATIAVWEDVFQTKFYEISQKKNKVYKVARCLHFTVPTEIAEHVDGIFNTVQLPDHYFGQRLRFEEVPVNNEKTTEALNYVTPDLL
eukprot:CAMPEP_0170358432 /NCGR_PEP_ID=MMETSP0117_2-20130122/2227_1 /TAXON_ID=400756 /ORGANISM="Durinskia baltica, Strain CSIRO CS-38" /LENGTH=223 /DNA_ID=CAMNT_0010612645 /DNA_START=78 /DNA_END=745 /DNA_ORIENTATION=+